MFSKHLKNSSTKNVIYDNNCLKCVNYLATRSCMAYPEPGGIPDKIWEGENGHKRKYPGDHGIQFDPRKAS